MQHSSHLRKIGACLLASTPKPEEREFVVDSGASMQMICKKELSDAEMDTLTKYRAVIPHHHLQPRLLQLQLVKFTREREDGINIDTSPVQVSTSVGDGSGQPGETQANKTPQNEIKRKPR